VNGPSSSFVTVHGQAKRLRRPGTTVLENGRVSFRVWAPNCREVAVVLVESASSAQRLKADGRGYFEGILDGVSPAMNYLFLLDGSRKRPDPASRFQPDGPHGTSQVVSCDRFEWRDAEFREACDD